MKKLKVLKNTFLALHKQLFVLLFKALLVSGWLFGVTNHANAADAVHADDAAILTVAQLLEYQNIAWIIWGGVLVFFMQAGFALLESGSVRAKNVVNVMMKNYTDMCIGGLAFYLIGFGLMMGANDSGFIGTNHFMVMGLSNFDWAVMFFQMMFAATAVTIASGAMAERVSFIGYAVAACIICAFIYPIFASWVWGGYLVVKVGLVRLVLLILRVLQLCTLSVVGWR